MNRSGHALLLLTLLAACTGGPNLRATVPGEQAGSISRKGRVPAAQGLLKGVVDVDTGEIAANGTTRFALLTNPTARATGGRVIARSSNYTGETDIGPDGEFTMRVPAGADYLLEAIVPDGAGGVTKYVSSSPVSIPVAQDPSAVDTLSLVTRQTGSIQGLISLDAPGPEDSLEGIDVFIAGGTSVVGKAGETGRFALANVAAGLWNVVISKPGYKRQVVKQVEVRAGRPTVLESPVVLVKDDAPQAGCTGEVREAAGRAVVGAVISVYQVNRAAQNGDGLAIEAYTTTSNAQGRYAVRNLPPGDYTVQIFHPSFSIPSRLSLTLALGETKDLGPTELVKNALTTGRITGVVQKETGEPVQSALVVVAPPVADVARTDASGGFDLNGLLPGEYTLTIAAEGFVPAIVAVNVDDRLDFKASLSAPIRLKVGSSATETPSITVLPVLAPKPKPEPTTGSPSTIPKTTTPKPTSPSVSPPSNGPIAPTGSASMKPTASPIMSVPSLAPPPSTTAPSPTAPSSSPPRSAKATVFAGSTQGFADGGVTQAQFSAPEGIALGPDGSIYVADTGNHRIRKVAADGTVSTVAGAVEGNLDGIGAAAQFSWPRDLAVGGDGFLYVADEGNNLIRKVSTSGEVTTLAGSLAGNVDGKGAAARFYYPSAIVSGPDGNLFVTSGSTIVKVTLDGVATKFAGSKNLQGNTDGPLTSALFSYPSGLAMGLDGTLFVADKGNYVVRAVASDGIVSTPKNLSTKGQPVFLSIDPNGIMCLTYKSGNIISLRGTKNSVIQDFLPAELSSPSGVVACAPNEFYVADRLTHKIYKIQFKY